MGRNETPAVALSPVRLKGSLQDSLVLIYQIYLLWREILVIVSRVNHMAGCSVGDHSAQQSHSPPAQPVLLGQLGGSVPLSSSGISRAGLQLQRLDAPPPWLPGCSQGCWAASEATTVAGWGMAGTETQVASWHTVSLVRMRALGKAKPQCPAGTKSL